MTKIEYRTLNDLAYDRIREGLMAGSFHPGQVLVIRSLAESYGISTTPVREALQRLVAERLLAALPNRSIAVPALEAGKYAELARIRCELEGLAAELAAPRLKKAALRRLVRLADDMDESLVARDHDAYRRQNQAFHLGVYGEAASPRLYQMIEDLWSQTGPYMKELFGAPGYEPKANEAHRAIIAALEAGDGARARAGVVADLTVAGGFLIPHLERVEAARRLEAAPA